MQSDSKNSNNTDNSNNITTKKIEKTNNNDNSININLENLINGIMKNNPNNSPKANVPVVIPTNENKDLAQIRFLLARIHGFPNSFFIHIFNKKNKIFFDKKKTRFGSHSTSKELAN